jgi:hypothetical protein
MEALKAQWESKKGVILGIIIGLLVGPLISGTMGWQVSRAFLIRSVNKAVVAQQASFCEFRARAAVKEPGKMEFTARYELAEKWAKLPGQTNVDSDVISACADGLSG